MNKNKNAIIQGIVISRRNLFELILVAVVLAFAVNLIANHLSLSFRVAIIIGVLICIACVLYLLLRLLIKRSQIKNFQAFLVYDIDKNSIISVPRYEFSEEVVDYLEAAFKENPAPKTLWEKEPLRNDINRPATSDRIPKSVQLIREITEYFVLSQLSIHLTDYFNDDKFREENLKEYCRDDIPGILLSNRFLELFSHPLENRPAFVEEAFSEKGDGILEWSSSRTGALYERFELVLPKESKLRRLKDSTVELETERLKMYITVRFEGINTVLPQGFEQYYLGIDSTENTEVYKLEVEIKVSMKLGALFWPLGWEYYRWVDSFLAEMENKIERDAFFERIGWQSALTLLLCLERSKRDASATKSGKPSA